MRRPALDFGNGLNEVCPLTSTTVRMHAQGAVVQVERISTQPADLTPAQARIGRGGHDRPVEVRDRRQELGPQVGAADDPLMGVALAPLQDADLLRRCSTCPSSAARACRTAHARRAGKRKRPCAFCVSIWAR